MKEPMMADDMQERAAKTVAKIIRNVDEGEPCEHGFTQDDWRTIVRTLRAAAGIDDE
jgi:hypothetical protein